MKLITMAIVTMIMLSGCADKVYNKAKGAYKVGKKVHRVLPVQSDKLKAGGAVVEKYNDIRGKIK